MGDAGAELRSQLPPAWPPARLPPWLSCLPAQLNHSPAHSLARPPIPPTLHCPPQEDFMKAVRKLGEAKKLEGHLAYGSEWDKSGS